MKALILLVLCLKSSIISCHSVDFNRDLVSVWWNTFIFPGDAEVPDAYGEKELTKMIKTISYKFDKVVLEDIQADVFPSDHSRSLAASVVAKFNRGRITTKHGLIEVVMTYKAQGGNIHTNFNLMKKLADNANYIHPGTVTTLMLSHVDKLTGENLQIVMDSLSQAKKEIVREKFHKYKLGITVSLSDCGESDKLDHILNYTDVLMFRKEDSKHFLESSNMKIAEELEACSENFLKNRNKTEIGFVLQHPATSPGGNESVSELVQFWREINQWVERLNTSVVLFEAFDNFREREKCAFCGWWRAKGGESGSLLDFVLEEKATPAVKKDATTSQLGFNRENFMVMFEPWVAPYDFHIRNTYGQQGLINMVNKISSRFSKVGFRYNPPVTNYAEGKTESLVLSTIAQRNKQQQSERPMEAVPFCLINLTSNSTEQESFTVARRFANAANTIYPGTVKTIILDCSHISFTEEFAEYVKAVLLNIKEASKRESKFKYSIGLLLSHGECGHSTLRLPDFLLPIISMVDVIQFSLAPSPSQIEAAVDFGFPTIFRNFERCLTKLRKVDKNIFTGFQTEWPDMSSDSEKNISALVDYWRKANDWAVAVNTTVIMKDAFDVHVKDINQPFMRTKGWWKLDTSREYRYNFDFQFIEKATLVQLQQIKDVENFSKSESISTVYSHNLNTWTLIIILIVFFDRF